MRILFVLKQIDYEPLGLMQMASVLRAGGHEVRLAAATMDDVAQVACEWQPGILAYSVWTGGQQYYVELNRRLRQAVDAFSVFGGPHATFFPEMIEDDTLMDGVCVGEGEGALLDLADALETGAPYIDIPNWHFRANGRIVCNPVRPAIANLNELPMPDRALIYGYDPISRQNPIKHFITGRAALTTAPTASTTPGPRFTKAKGIAPASVAWI